ncbi:hypothetical protein [Spongiimicrobium sp. 3-5]|uniref:hypothetical protein n=1 Tax=Spongiimicrobium sp. 3-5 TaxID=3332596 RepID=UPI00397EA348
MEINYSKNELSSFAKHIMYYLSLGIALNLFYLIITWLLSEQDLSKIYSNPFFSPYNGLFGWMLLGALVGLFRLNKKYTFSRKKWSRTFLFMVIFSVFITSFQIYYVHRIKKGWNGLTYTEKGLPKFHSFFLIEDKGHFKDLDADIRSFEKQKNSYEPGYYFYNPIDQYKGEFIDYDVITPRIMWILVVFIVFSLIELMRRYGPIGFYKNLGAYGNLWKYSFSSYNRKKLGLVLMGASINLIFLAFLPKINGYPRHIISVFLILGALVATIRYFLLISGNGEAITRDKIPKWFLLLLGVIVSSLLLAVFGMRIIYYLLVICCLSYLLVTKRLSPSIIKSIVLVFLIMDSDILMADDATWKEGSNLSSDPDGGRAIQQAKKAGDAGAMTASVAGLKEKLVSIDPNKGGKKEDKFEKGSGEGFENPFAKKPTETNDSEASDNQDSGSGIIIDEPLGED